jgi:hypothetical protein
VAGQQDRPSVAETASDDLAQRMERLPPGHPSSPYDENGTRKPPVARATERELLLPDEQPADAEPADPDSRHADRFGQGFSNTHDLTPTEPESPETDGRAAAGQETRADEAPGTDTDHNETPNGDVHNGEARIGEPPSSDAPGPDTRSWSEALPYLKEQWERHEERWPQEQRPEVDRSTDEPGSWRGEGDQYLNAEENLVAGHALERIRPIEEKVNATLHEIKTEVPGCDLVGLKFSLKGEERFKEKVSDEVRAKPDRSIAEITERMPDAVRYTFQLNADRYVDGYWNLRHHLELSGSELLLSRNSWDSPDYKGVNTRWLGPDGQVFEVQFHTPESYQAKQLTHTAYERLRTENAPGAERPELEAFQQEVSVRIPVPDGATGIPDYRKHGY